MTIEEIKKSSIMRLVARLYVIDSKLNGSNQELIKEYNEIVEELWYIVEYAKNHNIPPTNKIK